MCTSACTEPKERDFTEGTGEETPKTTKNKVFSQSLGLTVKKKKKRRIRPARKQENLRPKNKCGECDSKKDEPEQDNRNECNFGLQGSVWSKY